jgi:putative Mg2+ transporter-C (MgtC) family protein
MLLNQELVYKLVLSVVIGGAIGIERELRSKSAGFRTLMLICLGATLFTIFSQYIGGAGNPDRIASNVVTGIGFLGAGIIFRDNNRVSGITTAASIWLSAALGVGIGCGYYSASILGGVLVITILVVFSVMDNFLDKLSQVREYKITFPYEKNQEHKYEKMFHSYGLGVKSRSQSKSGALMTGKWIVKGKEHNHHRFIEHILMDSSIIDFNF